MALALHLLIEDNVFSDITVVLSDGTNKLELGLHKNILYCSCQYFRRMLTNFKEKAADTIELIVPHAYVTHDIIMGFYQKKTNRGNLPEWQHILTSYLCLDYFGLPLDIELLDRIWFRQIPPEYSTLVFQVCEILHYHETIVRKMINYDIIKHLPEENATQLVSCASIMAMYIIYLQANILYKTNIKKVEQVHRLELNPLPSFNIVAYAHNNKNLYLCSDSNLIQVIRIRTLTLVSTIPVNQFLDSKPQICCSMDKTQIAFNMRPINVGSIIKESYIYVYGAKNHSLVYKLQLSVVDMCYSLDSNMLMCLTPDSNIVVYQAKTAVLMKQIRIDSVTNIYPAPKNWLLVRLAIGKCIMQQIHSKQTVDLSEVVGNICFASDQTIMAVAYVSHLAMIDVETHQVLYQVPTNSLSNILALVNKLVIYSEIDDQQNVIIRSYVTGLILTKKTFSTEKLHYIFPSITHRKKVKS